MFKVELHVLGCSVAVSPLRVYTLHCEQNVTIETLLERRSRCWIKRQSGVIYLRQSVVHSFLLSFSPASPMQRFGQTSSQHTQTKTQRIRFRRMKSGTSYDSLYKQECRRMTQKCISKRLFRPLWDHTSLLHACSAKSVRFECFFLLTAFQMGSDMQCIWLALIAFAHNYMKI